MRSNAPVSRPDHIRICDTTERALCGRTPTWFIFVACRELQEALGLRTSEVSESVIDAIDLMCVGELNTRKKRRHVLGASDLTDRLDREEPNTFILVLDETRDPICRRARLGVPRVIAHPLERQDEAIGIPAAEQFGDDPGSHAREVHARLEHTRRLVRRGLKIHGELGIPSFALEQDRDIEALGSELIGHGCWRLDAQPDHEITAMVAGIG